MHNFLFLTWMAIVTVACDSPMNHRVEPENKAQKKLEALKFDSLSLTVEVQWLTGPVGNIESTSQLLAIVKDSNGVPIQLPEGLSLNFYATMPSMGHPMDDAGYFEDLGKGIYMNTAIRFNMPGDWKNELWIMDSEFNIKDKVTWSEFF